MSSDSSPLIEMTLSSVSLRFCKPVTKYSLVVPSDTRVPGHYEGLEYGGVYYQWSDSDNGLRVVVGYSLIVRKVFGPSKTVFFVVRRFIRIMNHLPKGKKVLD